MNDKIATARLDFSNASLAVELPVYKGTQGPDAMDIRTLYSKSGKLSYDPGFMATASCRSAISYIDGEKGELLYRGYPINNWPFPAITWTPATFF